MLKSRVSSVPDLSRVAKAVSFPGIDPRCWVCIGYVEELGVDEEGPFVDVTLMPSEEVVPARVASIYAGPSFGFYFPLEKDDEVIVFAPNGDPNEGLIAFGRQWSKSDPPPQEVQDDPACAHLVMKKDCTFNLKVSGTGDINITADQGDVNVTIGSGEIRLGNDQLLPDDGIVTGKAVDTLTGATFFALGNASLKVKAQKD